MLVHDGKFHGIEQSLEERVSAMIDTNVNLTCGLEKSKNTLLRSRLNTVHLDEVASFGGLEKFERDSTWTVRKSVSPVDDCLVISLERASRPGSFLHCTRTRR